MLGTQIRLLLACLAITLSGTRPLHAGSCSGGLKVCNAYCQKNYDGHFRCLQACQGHFQDCMSTGCWESRVTARRCGFARE